MSCSWKNLFVDEKIPLGEVGNDLQNLNILSCFLILILNFEHFVLFQSIYLYIKVQILNNKNIMKLWKKKVVPCHNSLSSTYSQSFVKNKKLFSYFRELLDVTL